MIDFSSWLDLPFLWGFIIATAVFLYAVLDGLDLGCGILFPFAPTDKCRSRMMNSISPYWDGNETWLVLGGGGLLVAFPVAYAVLLPAFYIPLIIMLLGLIFRGVAFELRFKAAPAQRHIWDKCFFYGSTIAAFMQGIILGNFVQGVEVNGRSFAGGSFDWVNPFALLTGVALLGAYALLGSAWLVMKTEGETQRWARSTGRYLLLGTIVGMAGVSIYVPFIEQRFYDLWLSMPNMLYLSILPIISLMVLGLLWKDFSGNVREARPFFLVIAVFTLGYIGFGISLYPWIVPYKFTLWEAAAASTSQSIMLIGTVILLPIILSYTAYCYYVFRGKSSHEALY